MKVCTCHTTEYLSGFHNQSIFGNKASNSRLRGPTSFKLSQYYHRQLIHLFETGRKLQEKNLTLVGTVRENKAIIPPLF